MVNTNRKHLLTFWLSQESLLDSAERKTTHYKTRKDGRNHDIWIRPSHLSNWMTILFQFWWCVILFQFPHKKIKERVASLEGQKWRRM